MRRIVALLFMLLSTAAWAGTPMVTLSDVAEMRLSGISFFLALILLVALGFRFLWNFLRRDFPRLPHLEYKRALALVVLLGLCFNLILLMIAGTRELMTPGAWEKGKTIYQLKQREGGKP